MESLFQLSDTAGAAELDEVRAVAEKVSGVLGVSGVRCRHMSSNVMMTDVVILIEPSATATEAQQLAGRVRDAVMLSNAEIAEVLVRTSTCPLVNA